MVSLNWRKGVTLSVFSNDRRRTDSIRAYEEGNFNMRTKTEALILTDDLLENLHNLHMIVVDARPAGQYSGSVKDHNSPHPGQVEGAVNLPFTLLTVEDAPHVFKPREALQEVFESLNIQAWSTLVTYCGSGIWASPVHFAARYLGYQVRFYDASFQEWGSNESLPVTAPDTIPE